MVAVVLLAVMALTGVPDWSAAQRPGGSVAGEVRSATGDPLADVTVAIEGTPLGTSTSAAGTFVIRAVPAGTHTVVVRRIGYEGMRRSILVRPGETVRLALVVSAQAIRLSSVEVTGSREAGYRSEHTATALKVDVPLRDIPQAVQVVPRAVLDDQQAVRLGDGLKNVAGLVKTGEFLGAYEYFSARGFPLSNTSNFLRDGRQFFHLAAPPMETLERLEGLKGPSSVLYGQAEPGGVVNMVSKMPTAEPYRALSLAAGSYDLRYATADVGGPVAGRADLGYRANLAVEDRASFRDVVALRRGVGAGVLTWDFAPRSALLVQGDYQRNENVQDTGIPVIGRAVADVPRDRFVNLPWSRYDADVVNAGAQLSHVLSDAWRLRSWLNYQYYERHRVDAQPRRFDEATGDVTLRTRDRVNRFDTYYADLNLVGTGRALGAGHTFLAGVDYIRRPSRFEETATNKDFVVNLFTPRLDVPEQTFEKFPDPNRGLNTTTGLYVQDQLRVAAPLDLLLSVRYDQFYSEFLSPSDSSAERKETAAFSPRLGVVYRPAESVSLYGSYSTGFVPNGFSTQGTNVGEELDAERAAQYEVGAKATLLGGRLAATLAAFDLTKRNIARYDAAADRTVLTGAQRHRGVELDAAGSIAAGWQVIGALALLDAAITDDPVNAGRTPLDAPRTSGSLWTAYELSARPLRGLRLGAGVFFQGERQGDNENSFTLDGYRRTDASVGYRRDVGPSAVTLRLNVENVTDEIYYFGGSRLGVLPGTPRSIRLSTVVEF